MVIGVNINGVDFKITAYTGAERLMNRLPRIRTKIIFFNESLKINHNNYIKIIKNRKIMEISNSRNCLFSKI